MMQLKNPCSGFAFGVNGTKAWEDAEGSGGVGAPPSFTAGPLGIPAALPNPTFGTGIDGGRGGGGMSTWGAAGSFGRPLDPGKLGGRPAMRTNRSKEGWQQLQQ